MAPGNDLLYSAALRDFHEARRQAAIQDFKARVTGKSDDLLSYEEISKLLKVEGVTKLGLQDIPLDAIVGSVGRYNDFTRTFLPRRDSARERWAKIKLKATYRGGLPPIEVYKIGQTYFVLDGNHRVSVVRQLGGTHIQAYVTEVHTQVPLSPDVSPDELIISVRRAEFMRQSGLGVSHPEADLSVTAPGQYRVLEAQIAEHRRKLALEREGTVPFKEAAGGWYEDVYEPVARIIRDQEILSDFPGRTETDLYVWASRRQEELEEELGWDVRSEAVVGDLAARYGTRLERVVSRLSERLLDSVPVDLEAGPEPGQWRREQGRDRTGTALFPDVLVPISGSERGWLALDQALIVAERERSTLHGFHVVRSTADRNGSRAQAVQEAFDRRCRMAGVPGRLTVEVGPVARTICQRARWSDLVVANLAHPPGPGPVRKLGSGFGTLIRRCSRPILAVPRVLPLNSALLAYDGSPKSQEALFVATCLARRWRIPLVALTVLENHRTTSEAQAQARDYLEQHGVAATYVEAGGPVADAILDAADQAGSDLIILGGYGFKPALELVLGSTVDRLLRDCTYPLLICR